MSDVQVGQSELRRGELAAQADRRTRTPVRYDRALGLGAAAIGALAVGACAIGALAIGRLAIGALTLKHGRVRSLTVDRLDVRQLHVAEVTFGSDVSRQR